MGWPQTVHDVSTQWLAVLWTQLASIKKLLKNQSVCLFVTAFCDPTFFGDHSQTVVSHSGEVVYTNILHYYNYIQKRLSYSSIH